MLPLAIALLLGTIALFVYSLVAGIREVDHPYWIPFTAAILGHLIAILMLPGFFSLQPNEARVLVLFGAYSSLFCGLGRLFVVDGNIGVPVFDHAGARRN